ncbi:hypothetical protein GCM10010361_31080 [Streptomyces olivaceiscleroticus]|uniref:Secreted protein n=1 Tax=Streptomyces olivaceiscleroticus TaxID=68245 RepID=A0ABN1A0X1_9ACTN
MSLCWAVRTASSMVSSAAAAAKKEAGLVCSAGGMTFSFSSGAPSSAAAGAGRSRNGCHSFDDIHFVIVPMTCYNGGR